MCINCHVCIIMSQKYTTMIQDYVYENDNGRFYYNLILKRFVWMLDYWPVGNKMDTLNISNTKLLFVLIRQLNYYSWLNNSCNLQVGSIFVTRPRKIKQHVLRYV